MRITDVLDESRIDLNLKAKSKDEVLQKVVDLFDKSGVLYDKTQFLKDVYFRESEGPTGMGDGFCIPHGKSDAVKKTSIAVCRCENEVTWESLDGNPIRVIVMMAVRNADKSELVSLLSQVAIALCDESVVDKLFKTQNAKEVIALFDRKEVSE